MTTILVTGLVTARTARVGRASDPAGSQEATGDKDQIAFVSDRDGNNEIYVMAADGTNVVRLTNDPADDCSPAWSPDGAKIAFERDDDIYVIDADGSNLINLTMSPVDENRPVWSPRGDKITYERLVNNSNHICIMDAEGSDYGVLVDQGISWCCPQAYTWSPGGSQITYERNDDIYTLIFDEGVPRNLTNNAARDSDLAWQPLNMAPWRVYLPLIIR